VEMVAAAAALSWPVVIGQALEDTATAHGVEDPVAYRRSQTGIVVARLMARLSRSFR